MLFLEKEIDSITQQKDICIIKFGLEESRSLRLKIINKYFDGKNGSQLWNQFLPFDDCTVRDAKAWQWLDEFLLTKDVVLFFDKPEDTFLYKIPTNQSKVDFLKEIVLYTFYITNEDLDFLVYFNDTV